MRGQSNTMKVFDFRRYKRLHEQTFHRALQDQGPEDAAKAASLAVNALANSEKGSEAITYETEAVSPPSVGKTERMLVVVPDTDSAPKPAVKRRSTKQMPVVESVDKAGLHSFSLADSDPQIDDAYEQLRQNAKDQMRNQPALPKTVVELQPSKPEIPKPKSNARKYNPRIWELIDFWLTSGILTKDQYIILVRSIAKCIVHVPVSDATTDNLCRIIEDEGKTAKLLKKERQYWLEMPVKKMAKWEWLHDERYFHPLFKPEDEFSASVVHHCLLLLFAFRQHYPTVHWIKKIWRKIMNSFCRK